MPYLFLLCSEGLTGRIKKVVHENKIRGFSLCKNGPKISQLFFVDDNLLFFHAQLGDIQCIQNILELYEKALRQQINKNKITLFFSISVSSATKETIKVLLGILEIKEYERYLDLPTVVGRNKKASLIFIKERVWGKIQGWKEKLLSQVGKEILLKAVVQAIPTFAISCFLLPVSHWKKLLTLCQPKDKRGLGFKDLCKFNKSMLAKKV